MYEGVDSMCTSPRYTTSYVLALEFSLRILKNTHMRRISAVIPANGGLNLKRSFGNLNKILGGESHEYCPRSSAPIYFVTRQSGLAERTPNAGIALPQHVCVNLRRAEIPVTEQLLHRANVAAATQEFCRKGMAERVTADWLLN